MHNLEIEKLKTSLKILFKQNQKLKEDIFHLQMKLNNTASDGV